MEASLGRISRPRVRQIDKHHGRYTYFDQYFGIPDSRLRLSVMGTAAQYPHARESDPGRSYGSHPATERADNHIQRTMQRR